VNELRLGTALEETKAGLGVQEGGFFNEDGSLKEQIAVDGTPIDCEPTVENPAATALDCYDAMATYFESFDGQREMLDVCDQLQLKTFNNKQLEQSTLRIRLCSEMNDAVQVDASCTALADEVETQMSDYPDKDCSGFGFGTQSTTIPGCEDNESGGGGGDDDGGDESAAAATVSTIMKTTTTTTVAALVVSMMMLLCL
jgi:hypothetical protein